MKFKCYSAMPVMSHTMLHIWKLSSFKHWTKKLHDLLQNYSSYIAIHLYSLVRGTEIETSKQDQGGTKTGLFFEAHLHSAPGTSQKPWGICKNRDENLKSTDNGYYRKSDQPLEQWVTVRRIRNLGRDKNLKLIIAGAIRDTLKINLKSNLCRQSHL